MVGWSGRSCFFTADDTRGHEVVTLLRNDHANYEFIQSNAATIAGWNVVYVYMLFPLSMYATDAL